MSDLRGQTGHMCNSEHRDSSRPSQASVSDVLGLCRNLFEILHRERAALFHSVVYFAPEFKFDVNTTMKCEAERDRT